MIFWKLKVIDQSQTFKKTFISLIPGVEEVKILRVVCIFYDAIKWSPLRICDRNSVRYCLKERKSWVQLHNKKCKFHNKYKLCEEISVKMMQCLIILFIVGISQLNGKYLVLIWMVVQVFINREQKNISSYFLFISDCKR